MVSARKQENVEMFQYHSKSKHTFQFTQELYYQRESKVMEKLSQSSEQNLTKNLPGHLKRSVYKRSHLIRDLQSFCVVKMVNFTAYPPRISSV